MRTKRKDFPPLSRRQFVHQAGLLTGMGLGSLKASAHGEGQPERSQQKERKIILGEDGPWWFYGDGRLTRKPLERLVGEIAGVVDTLAALMAMPDICFYPTKVGDLFGAGLKNLGPADRIGETQAVIFWQHIHNIHSLIESGNDPALVLPEECHKRGMEALARVKMNDAHHVNPRFQPYRSQFLMKNPQWHLYKHFPVLDYSHREVREHRFAILQELVTRYDWDGLELDFTRSPHLFPIQVAEKRAPIMTEFLHQIRELLDQEGKKKGKGHLVLGARVPDELKVCKQIGLDLPTWVKQGLLDYVAPGAYSWTEFSMKVEDFKALTQGTSCGLYPSFQGHPISSVPGMHGPRTQTREMYRAAAHNYYTWGADGIHFYNLHAANFAIPLSFEADLHDASGERAHRGMYDREMLRDLRDPKTVARRSRHYVFLPHDDLQGEWFRTDPTKLTHPAASQNVYHPIRHTHLVSLGAGEVGKRKVFPFRIAEDFTDPRARAVFRFKAVNQTFEDQIEVDLNGSSLPMEKFHQTYHWRGVSHWGVLPPYYQYEMALSSPPAQKGDNELGVKLVRKNRELETVDIYIQDVEVVIEYRDS